MPNFGFNTRGPGAVAVGDELEKKQHSGSLPVGVKFTEQQTPEEIEKEKRMLEGEGAFFVKKGCFVYHSVSTLGVESASKIGPDLSEAVTDVQSRFGKQLEDFLNNPTGTMAVVLSTQIVLSPEEKREAVEKLKIAYQKKVEQKTQAATGQPQAKPSPTPKK